MQKSVEIEQWRSSYCWTSIVPLLRTLISWLFLFLTIGVTNSLPNIKHATVCSTELLQLNCNSEDYILAIHQAIFSTDDSYTNYSCFSVDADQEISHLEVCAEDIRVSLNNRCAGRSQCQYNYSHDHIDSSCSTDGVLIIDYECVDASSSILNYCNFPTISREGYISSPGYPSFFPRLQNCTWNLTAGEGQTLSITLLDLHLRPPRPHKGREICDEALTIYDGPNAAGTRVTTACGHSPLGVYETTSNSAVVNFNSEKFTPFRGFLLYYRYQGCPTIPSPKQGHLVIRNGSLAYYTCCAGHLFNDTLENTRTLHCVDDFFWNGTVPDCLTFAEIREGGNYTNIEFVWNPTEEVLGSKTFWADNNMMADIIIPSALMASLIIGNAVVLIIILKIRRKSKYNDNYMDDDDQPKPCSSTEPNHSEV